ncbi:MAG: F0F1 ATP synthase subunit A [Bacillota bacterium]|nr:F0F1 ATP synthase subunit A [Bacillota bacterium]
MEPLHPHVYWHVLGFTFDGTILMYSWATMAVVFLLGLWAVRQANPGRPTPLQNAFELLLETMGGFVREQIHPKQRHLLLSVVASLFTYLLVANLVGLIPGQTSPTADLNVTMGMAIGVFFLVQISGLYVKGIRGYIDHVKGPIKAPLTWLFFAPLTIVEELSKPLTLAFRLFGNIFAGEILLGLLVAIPVWLGGFIPAVAWMAFSIFVGFIQAFIFTVLTLAYVGIMTSEDH